MKRVTLIATALVLAVVAVFTTRVMAQETNTQEITYLTFSNSVEMPGVTLPAGTYTFRLADTPSRNVVQVLDRDQKNVMGQWLFVQAERPQVSQDTVVMFKENREGATPAIQYWYFPGEKIGKEFIYPKNQAEKIAARTGQQVRTESGYVSSNTAVTSTNSKGETTEWKHEGPATASADNPNAVQGASGLSADADSTLRNAPAPAQPTASAGSLTGNRGIEPSSQIARQDTDRDVAVTSNQPTGTSGRSSEQPVGTSGQLPKTGSDLPLAGLIGLLSLVGALGTRFVSTRA
jgi:hypothetical protein